MISETVKLVMNDALLERITEILFYFQKKGNRMLPLLRKQLTEIEKGIENILDAI